MANTWVYSSPILDGVESWETNHSFFGKVAIILEDCEDHDNWYLVCNEEFCSFRLDINVRPDNYNIDLVLYRADNILHQLSVLL